MARHLIDLRIARVGLLLLGGLYLLGGVAAVSGFFQMRAGPAGFAAWFASNGMPPSGFLIAGVFYSAIGFAGIGAARLLRKRKATSYVLAGVFIALVAFDFLGDLVRKRTSGLDREDFLAATLTGGILLVTTVCLARTRPRSESDFNSGQ
jgi:hypothetical protein